MTQVDPETLLPNEHVKQAVAAGEITQMTRGQAYVDEGDTFDIDGDAFEVTSVEEIKLGDLTDADAQREGSADLDAYKERLVRVHGGDFEWNDDADVVRHQFEPQSSEN
ncbi:ASCH domain-containing protein [Halonotius terrestris]|uniref:ASCH domain-containing protein n=1 Tax=Halonotius terrestris TaxID=2487750 RepID=A0A8J8TBR8_9EURY|nr:ASCH domain-containing protein [Halonotius terrestris]TQQ82650.1 ASCH domain-containing protein [Halonotius terrestris]